MHDTYPQGLTCSICSASYQVGDRYCPQCGERCSSAYALEGMSTHRSLNILEIQYRLGMVYFRKGDYVRAVAVWEKVKKGRPRDSRLDGILDDARSRLQESERVS